NAVSLNSTRVQAVAGFVVVVFGLAFAGLLPFPERLVAPGLVGGARRRGSGALLGAAFAVCAAPCMGPVLGTILVLAGSTTTVARLLELAFATNSVAPTGLVPRDGDVHEALEEVALGRLGRAPGVFELLMGGEEFAGSDQSQAALERIISLPRVFRARSAPHRL